MELKIKHMVCNRCIKVVTQELVRNNIDFVRVDLGVIHFDKPISKTAKEELEKILKKEGLDIITDQNSILINRIKTLVIGILYNKVEKVKNKKFSSLITEKLGVEYSILSKLFSKAQSKTIEHYIIEQRIEKAKELLSYNQLSISEISYELNYSSPQHLSRQFKQLTGMTPTQFKRNGVRKNIDTI